MNRLLALLLASLALGLAACGDDDESDSGAADTATTEQTETTAAEEPAGEEPAGEGGKGKSISKDLDKKPAIPKPSGDAPSKLESEDVVVGKGATAKSGNTVSVQYVGVSFSTGEEFDASWNTGQPFEFELGAGMVIPGWDQGVAGMKVGGRRKLTIPPDLAYGPQGSPPAIGPNETLVFVVDLLDVK